MNILSYAPETLGEVSWVNPMCVHIHLICNPFNCSNHVLFSPYSTRSMHLSLKSIVGTTTQPDPIEDNINHMH